MINISTVSIKKNQQSNRFQTKWETNAKISTPSKFTLKHDFSDFVVDTDTANEDEFYRTYYTTCECCGSKKMFAQYSKNTLCSTCDLIMSNHKKKHISINNLLNKFKKES